MLVTLAVFIYPDLAIGANQQTNVRQDKSNSNGLVELGGGNWWEHGHSNPVIHMIVDKVLQRVSVYSNGALVTRSNVSTGKRGHETPGGIFSILTKSRIHHSNIYSRAPMPFMQRLTWSGIALHKSKSVPEYPASHGCVRLPGKFAGKLFQYTRKGAQVIITNRDISPRRILSPHLFEIGDGTILEASNLRPGADVVSGPQTPRVEASPKQPLRVLITRHIGRQRVIETQQILNELKYSAGDTNGWMGPQTGKAIIAFQNDYRHKVTGALSEELLGQLYRATGRGKPKSAHVYVRRNHLDLFDEAVILRDENTPLGTHQFVAVYPNQAVFRNNTDINKSDISDLAISNGPHWLALSIEQTDWPKRKKQRKRKKSYDALMDTLVERISPPASSAERALERIAIPEQLKQRISRLITPGSTIIIADEGFSRETGKGTDFIVLTK
ncbi:MAG: L,D-transpeptidase family protein [Hyphomicrobiales bacterium]|nr:L,D-transpeptidase family protein [Hyphomicrobiales bacterium]